MMHLLMAITAIVVAVTWRLLFREKLNAWVRFALAPLLLLTTAIALVGMGNRGSMFGWDMGLLSTTAYGLGMAFLVFAIASLLGRIWQAWRTLTTLRRLTPCTWQGHPYLLLETDQLVAAQVGWWQSHLVLSQGLLAQLDDDHLRAIVYHESAHAYHRDTFWFFWWGWLKQISSWLPHSQSLWEELLLAREVRADQWAKQRCDYLLLAEALLFLVQDRSQNPWQTMLSACANDRLEQRINFLLSDHPTLSSHPHWQIYLSGLGLLPLLAIPWHSIN
jgi:Zn-dependent protease with chaperone function